jgi:hypothetical protein
MSIASDDDITESVESPFGFGTVPVKSRHSSGGSIGAGDGLEKEIDEYFPIVGNAAVPGSPMEFWITHKTVRFDSFRLGIIPEYRIISIMSIATIQ